MTGPEDHRLVEMLYDERSREELDADQQAELEDFTQIRMLLRADESEAPPAFLDAKILAAARASAEEKQKRGFKAWLSPWLFAPLAAGALAAVLYLVPRTPPSTSSPEPQPEPQLAQAPVAAPDRLEEAGPADGFEERERSAKPAAKKAPSGKRSDKLSHDDEADRAVGAIQSAETQDRGLASGREQLEGTRDRGGSGAGIGGTGGFGNVGAKGSASVKDQAKNEAPAKESAHSKRKALADEDARPAPAAPKTAAPESAPAESKAGSANRPALEQVLVDARVHLRARDFERAYAVLTPFLAQIERHPARFAFWLLLGEIELARGRNTEARAALVRAQTSPNETERERAAVLLRSVR